MKIVLIGSSTGGPNQLKFLLKDANLKNACVIIAQHMAANFIHSFIRQFNQEADTEVIALTDKAILKTNTIYICTQNTILEDKLKPLALLSEEKTTFNPNINLLFESAVSLTKSHSILAMVLTGMGDDGASGLLKLYKAGAITLCENEEDSVVYGMPKRAKDMNPQLMPMGLKELKRELNKFIEKEQNECN